MRKAMAGLVFLGVSALMLTGVSADESLRCKRGNIVKAVSVGDERRDVEAKCGEATAKEWVMDKDYGVVHLWAYNLGPDRIIHFLKLKKGRVVKIELGNLGY